MKSHKRNKEDDSAKDGSPKEGTNKIINDKVLSRDSAPAGNIALHLATTVADGRLLYKLMSDEEHSILYDTAPKGKRWFRIQYRYSTVGEYTETTVILRINLTSYRPRLVSLMPFHE